MDASAYSRLGDGIISLTGGLLLTCMVFVPLGVWKLVEIVVWLCHHIHLSAHLS